MPPMSPVARRFAAAAALLLSLAIVALLVMRGLGVQIGLSATPTPAAATPSPRPSEPAASQDPLAAFAEIEQQVRAIRGLPAAQVGPPRILTRAELAQVLPGLLEPALDDVSLHALGLLTAGQEIVSLTNRLYAAQVLGYYDFDAKRMVVVSDAGLTAAARVTYAHEYTHALQDAAFHAGAAQDRVAGERDQALALLALEEGDASTAMVLWAIGHLSADQLAGITATPLPDMSGIPAWMVRLLEFPYLPGSEFVGRLYASGGWAGVDAAYGHPPASTEQVLHPEKYSGGEVPVAVEALDPWTALGAGWSHVLDTTMGEEWIATWLEGLGVSAKAAAAAAAGWGGDRLTVANTADGRWALAWRIGWDAPGDATEFEAAYAGLQSRMSFAARAVHVSDRETVVLQASSASILGTIASLAGG